MGLAQAVPSYVGQFISGLWNFLSTSVGLGFASTIAVIKTDTNRFSLITCLLLMFASTLAALTYMIQLVFNQFTQMVASYGFQQISPLERIAVLALFCLLVFLFHPLIFFPLV